MINNMFFKLINKQTLIQIIVQMLDNNRSVPTCSTTRHMHAYGRGVHSEKLLQDLTYDLKSDAR